MNDPPKSNAAGQQIGEQIAKEQHTQQAKTTEIGNSTAQKPNTRQSFAAKRLPQTTPTNGKTANNPKQIVPQYQQRLFKNIQQVVNEPVPTSQRTNQKPNASQDQYFASNQTGHESLNRSNKQQSFQKDNANYENNNRSGIKDNARKSNLAGPNINRVLSVTGGLNKRLQVAGNMRSQMDIRQKTNNLATKNIGLKNIENDLFHVRDAPEPREKDPKKKFFVEVASRYNHAIFKKAGILFGYLRHETEDPKNRMCRTQSLEQVELKRRKDKSDTRIADVKFKDEVQRRLTFTLAYDTLKFQVILEDMLDDVGFYSAYPQHIEDYQLATVILCDFSHRGFVRRLRNLAAGALCNDSAGNCSANGSLNKNQPTIGVNRHETDLSQGQETAKQTSGKAAAAGKHYKRSTVGNVMNRRPTTISPKTNGRLKATEIKPEVQEPRQNPKRNSHKQTKQGQRKPLVYDADDRDVEVMLMEDAILEYGTKLAASLARRRIKSKARSLESLLPIQVRYNVNDDASVTIYGWVNLLKSSMEQVEVLLEKAGFIKENQKEEPVPSINLWKVYKHDIRCTDLLIFSGRSRSILEDHNIVRNGILVMQDLSSIFGPQSIMPMLNLGDDVLYIDIGTGISSIHLASLMNRDTTSSVILFNNAGYSNPDENNMLAHLKWSKRNSKILDNIKRMGATSKVKLITEDIMSLDPSDERIQHCRICMLTADCSHSGIMNPVNFLLTEDEDISLLKSLSRVVTEKELVLKLMNKHTNLLKHILSFPYMQGVVYCTRSVLSNENETVVGRSIDITNTLALKKTTYRVSPPTLPLLGHEIQEKKILKEGRFLNYPSSNSMSACFLATITREADDLKETAKEVLARAIKKGLIQTGDSNVVTTPSRVCKPTKTKSISSNKSVKSLRQFKQAPPIGKLSQTFKPPRASITIGPTGNPPSSPLDFGPNNTPNQLTDTSRQQRLLSGSELPGFPSASNGNFDVTTSPAHKSDRHSKTSSIATPEHTKGSNTEIPQSATTAHSATPYSTNPHSANPNTARPHSHSTRMNRGSEHGYDVENKKKRRKRTRKKSQQFKASNTSLNSLRLELEKVASVGKTVVVPEHSKVLQHPGPFR